MCGTLDLVGKSDFLKAFLTMARFVLPSNHGTALLEISRCKLIHHVAINVT